MSKQVHLILNLFEVVTFLKLYNLLLLEACVLDTVLNRRILQNHGFNEVILTYLLCYGILCSCNPLTNLFILKV